MNLVEDLVIMVIFHHILIHPSLFSGCLRRLPWAASSTGFPQTPTRLTSTSPPRWNVSPAPPCCVCPPWVSSPTWPLYSSSPCCRLPSPVTSSRSTSGLHPGEWDTAEGQTVAFIVVWAAAAAVSWRPSVQVLKEKKHGNSNQSCSAVLETKPNMSYIIFSWGVFAVKKGFYKQTY